MAKKPTYYPSGLIGVAKPSSVATAHMSRPSRMSRSSRMSDVNKKWLRLANERPQPWAQHMTDDSKIAQMKREASGQAPPSRKPKLKTPVKPKPGGGRRTRRKGVKVYARKRRGSAYSLKSAFNF